MVKVTYKIEVYHMHLALIISSLQTGGAERVLSELANAWSVKGYQISLITLSAEDEKSIYPLNSRVQLFPLNQASSHHTSLLERLKRIARRIFILRKTLKSLKPDAIISFVDVMNITTILATRFLEIPVLVSERTHPAYHKLAYFYKILRRLTYPYADKVISQTDTASNYFSTLPLSKKVVIPNSVNKPVRQKKHDDIIKPVHHIVSVGRLCPNKGLQILIRAFSKVLTQNPNLKLTIYGEGEMRANLEQLIKELDVANAVFLPGVIQDIQTALIDADLFAFPSYYEGFPNALCEALAIGLPVIASNCSGTIDIIQDGVGGRLFPVGDVNALTDLLQELITDISQRVMLSEKAQHVIERFSHTSVMKRWEDVLFQVINR
jgi:GalNAc-alpha-(1->4)-GalNAc-alpha-(1->3)-diNAcBac-PP-undecaprenol alpha-1,4-N-acetyl-D-galactosaminyltransferase